MTLVLSKAQCKIATSASYDVYAGGISMPIVYDFAMCMPFEKLTLTANITDPGTGEKDYYYPAYNKEV